VTVQRLLERDDQLAQLDATLQRARGGVGALVVVTGQPGIGKSSLVTAWLAGTEDVRVLQGACDDLVTPRTMGPFRDMVRGAGGPLADSFAANASRDEVLVAMQEEFSNPLRPTVVVIEDVHWADEATLDAVRFLGRRIDTEPTVLVVTVRDDLDPDHPLHAVLGAMPAHCLHRLELSGLTSAAVAELAGDSPVDPDRVHAITGGNPFFVTEVLAAPDQEVPATVLSAITARLRQVDDATRTALEQLAVAPAGLELHVIAQVVDGGVTALAEAERRGLVHVVDGRVRYTHAITRQAVLASCPAVQQAVAHARVLAALGPDHPDASRMLHHAIGAGDASSIVHHAPDAARAAARAGAHHDAAIALAQALRFPELLTGTRLATVLTEHARELLLTNQLDQGLEQARRAVAAAESRDDPDVLGGALTVLANASYWGLQADLATDAAAHAVALLRTLPPDQPLAWATSTLAFTQVMTNQFEDARATADDAVALARDLPAPDILPHALTQRGTARAMLGDPAGLDDLTEAFDAAVAIGHHEHVVGASIGLVSGAFRLGRLDEAERAMDVGLRYADEHDLEAGASTLHAMRAGLDLSRGHWAEAASRLEAVVGDGRATGWGETVATALLGRLRARRGDPDATDLLERAWRIAVASGEIQRVGPAGAAWAEWGWLTGQFEAVAERVDHAIDTARRVGHAWYLGEVLRFRALARADGTTSPVQAQTEGGPDPAADVAEPWASGLRGDWQAAAAAWEQRDRPYERALELVSSGRPDVMIEGLALLDQLGTDAAAALVRRQLQALGVRRIPRGPRADTRANPAGLTNRQAEILELVADGATNAEIADQLVLSVRTVDHHVSAMLGKLGVTKRREAVARARELGMLPEASTIRT
jgi:DNA-binding CsgD family transcriptional regulator